MRYPHLLMPLYVLSLYNANSLLYFLYIIRGNRLCWGDKVPLKLPIRYLEELIGLCPVNLSSYDELY